MKLAVVGHSYVHKFGQAKYVALKAADSALQLRLVVPRTVEHVLSTQHAERSEALGDKDLVICCGMFNGNHMTQLLDPFRMSRALSAFQPDILHIEEDPYSVMGMEALLLAKAQCPSARITFFTWDNLGRTPGFPKSLLKRWLSRIGFGRAALVICGNRDAQRILHERKGYTGRSVVIPQIGVTDEKELAKKRLYRNSGARKGELVTVAFVGRLVAEKGLLVLHEALQLIQQKPWRLMIVGHGPMAGEIRSGWGSYYGERLQFSTSVAHNKVSEKLVDADIFVLPSLSKPYWREQFGLTLVVAMMLGCACVGADSGAIPDVLGDAGILIPEDDPKALGQALAELIDSPGRRAHLGSLARLRALDKYTHEVVAAEHIREFRRVVAST